MNPVYPGLFFWPPGATSPLGLRGARCGRCGAIHFPHPLRCPTCASDQLTETRLSGQGRLVEWTTVYSPAPGFVAPYRVGYVDLPEGIRLFTLLEWPSDEPLVPGQLLTFRAHPFDDLPDGTRVLGYVFSDPSGEEQEASRA